jgi:hypothetical protein
MRRSRTGLFLVALCLPVACDLPTALPIYQTVWSVPGKSTSISVDNFLPAQVTPTPDESAFQIMLAPSSATISRSLLQDCAMCALANGQPVPKPAFTGSGSASFALPAAISSATLVRDTLTVTVANGFNFDPLQPSANARGYLIITVQNAGRIIGRDSVDGAATPLPPSQTIMRRIPLTGTLSSAGGVEVAMQLSSPAGDPVIMDASRAITITASVGALLISQAQVNLANQSVSAATGALNLATVDSSISRRVDGATLELTVTNPFNVSGNLLVTLAGAQPISKAIPITAGTTTPTVTFTAGEMRSLLGRRVGMSVAGTVTGSNVTVKPGQTVSLTSRLVLTLNVGGK